MLTASTRGLGGVVKYVLELSHSFDLHTGLQGRLDCDDKVLVDIGAGYMIQKTYQDEKKDAMR